jgi:hypothetical protein
MKEKKLITETHTVEQDTICENILNLCNAYSVLQDIDTAVLGDLRDRVMETKENILAAIYYQSTHLRDKDIS